MIHSDNLTRTSVGWELVAIQKYVGERHAEEVEENTKVLGGIRDLDLLAETAARESAILHSELD